MGATRKNLTDLLHRRGYWARCMYAAHRWPHRRCWRGMVYDGLCVKHVNSCYHGCADG